MLHFSLVAGLQSLYLQSWGEEGSKPLIQSFHFMFGVGAFLAPLIGKSQAVWNRVLKLRVRLLLKISECSTSISRILLYSNVLKHEYTQKSVFEHGRQQLGASRAVAPTGFSYMVQI